MLDFMENLHRLSLLEQSELITQQEIRSTELVSHYLKRIEEFNPQLGAFTTVTADSAREQSATFDASASDSPLHLRLLAGVPSADKDLDNRIGVPTSYGSLTAKREPATKNDGITEAANAAGLISLGKTHAPEFGLSGHALTRLNYICRNPWDLGTDPGGSSSGAAVAVSAGLVPAALASDAGGSIRIPASTTGVVGIKPSRQFFDFDGRREMNRNSVHGTIARSLGDAALLLDALKHPNVPKTQAVFLNAINRPKAVSAQPRRIAIADYTPWRETFRIELPTELQADFERSTKALKATGHEVIPIEIPEFEGFGKAFTMLWQKSAANISVSLADEPLLTDFTRWLRSEGNSYSAEEVAKSIRLMEEFECFFQDALDGYDALMTPALGLLPQKISWHDDTDHYNNFVKQCEYSPYTSFVNMAGLPAIVLPTALNISGLPMSIQLIGKLNQEEPLIELGGQFERELGWGPRFPKNFA
ncbi:MAG: amidase [Microbacteriaceae bacterium]